MGPKLTSIKEWIKNHLKLVLIIAGNLLSIAVFISTYCVDQLVEVYKLEIPTLQMLPIYFILFVSFAVFSCVKRDTLSRKSLKINWWKYFFYSLFDVEANFLLIYAFQYAFPASIQLLDASMLPIIMIISCVVFKTKYKVFHHIGIFLTITGIGAILFFDFNMGISEFRKGNFPIIGDIIVLVGCLCKAISEIIIESSFKETSYGEFLFFRGLFSTVVGCIQGVLLERHAFMNIEWNLSTIFLIIGFSVSILIFYFVAPYIIKHISASNFHTTFLISHIGSVIYTMLYYKNISPYYYCGVGALGLGYIMFYGQTIYSDWKHGCNTEINGIVTFEAADTSSQNYGIYNDSHSTSS